MYKFKVDFDSQWEDKSFAFGSHVVLMDGYYVLNIFLVFWDITIGFMRVD